MSTPYVGEIRLFTYARGVPSGWRICDGALLSIADNETLYQLVGTTYGGDGIQTFGVPDLRGRAPVHFGQGPGRSNYVLGQKSGTETVTLTLPQLPAHTHAMGATASVAARRTVANSVLAQDTSSSVDFFAPGTSPPTALAPTAIGITGTTAPHENMQPHLPLTWAISLFGIFPSQS